MIEWIKAFWIKWFGTGTEDDWRNPFWRVTEAMKVKVLWSKYLFDIRLFFKTNDKWNFYVGFLEPTEQNFWNGIFTFNVYVSKAEWMLIWPIIYSLINAILIGIPYLIWGDNYIPWLCCWVVLTIPFWIIHPRFNIVFRPLHDWYGECGAGILFDRGEFGLKLNAYHQEGGDAVGWNEGSV